MALSTRKTVTICLIACIAPFLGPISIAAETTESPGEKTLQPQSLDYAGIYKLRQLDPDLTGSGVKFAVICRSITYIDGEPQNDYRPNIGHNCFKAEQFGFHEQPDLPADISPHSTAICSILFGEDPDAFNQQLGQFQYQGTTPQAQAEIYEFWHFLINNVFDHSPPEADVVTASIGNQFEGWWTRGIEALAEHYGLIVVAGIGNGFNAYDPLLYPAAGTNIIGVGVVDSVNTEDLVTKLSNFSLAHPEHSSSGPTGNGRCKPDIIAPGNCMAADANQPNLYKPTGNWSSFSTPIVAGTVGLLVQKAKQDPNLSPAVAPDGGNCVMKAILMNSAKKLPYWHKGLLRKDDDHMVPLDYVQGAGMLNAPDAYKHLIAGQNKPSNVSTIGWDSNQLQKDQTLENIYKITVTEPDDTLITATAVWNRHYSREYPFEPIPEKDANLRLELWAVDTEDPKKDYLLDYSDSSADNIEHIYHRADANYTNYEIVVSYSDIDDSNQTELSQRYGLAWKTSAKQNNNDILWYDLNTDGIVNELDFMILVNNLLAGMKQQGGYLLGDINTDGTIDFKDGQILLDHNNLKADWYTE
ncbi:MAG: S8 family serine peptidase [Planctomycetota bacterium]|jgi:hypothetical protein